MDQAWYARSMSPFEREVVKRIIALLKSKGAWVIKSTGVSLVGCPDLIACYRGYFIGIEVKADLNGKYGVTAKQQHELSMIARAGGQSLAVDNVDQVRAVLDSIDNAER